MLTITDEATSFLAHHLLSFEETGKEVFRLRQEEGEFKLDLSEKQLGDATFEHDGKTVLVLDQDTAGLLDFKTIDAISTSAGTRLAFRPVN